MLHFKRFVLTPLLFAMAFQSWAHAHESESGTELHAQMQAALRDEGLVGMVWATVSPGGIASGAAGLANAETGQAISAESRVHTGSIIKTLIATGILRLVTEGRLSLDIPVAKLLPQLEFDNAWASNSPVRVRHLLDHTSGLDDARFSQVFSLNARPDTPLIAAIAPTFPLHVRSRPGSRLSYSNSGYTLLGMVIERVTGKRYEKYLDAHLLGPLGMRHSTFQFVSQTGEHADTQLAMGHFEEGAIQATVPLYLRPAGQFTTTASDMARFARFLMSNGEIEGRPFIAPDLLRAMGKPDSTEAVRAGLTGAGYGLGLNTRDRHGVVGRCHVGTAVGYRANFCLFPEEQKAFFVAMNADVETANYRRFDEMLVRALDVAAAERIRAAKPPDNMEAWQGIYVLAPSRTESFAYVDRLFNFATLKWDGEQLHLNPFQGTAMSLTPVGGWLFRAANRAQPSHILYLSEAGQRVVSDGFRSYEQISSWRMALLWASLTAGIGGLVYLIMAGAFRALRRRLRPTEPAFIPFFASVALLLPVPLFFQQSFLQLGDLTPASAALALVSAMLPLAMIYGLWRSVSPNVGGRRVTVDQLAMVGVLQWSIVLACWGLLPVRLWV